MSNKKQIHYNMDNLIKKNALYNMIIGERANGKSYQVKYKKAIQPFLDNKEKFVYMRRFKEEIKSSTIEAYFNDVDFVKLTNGKYNTVQYWRNRIYLANYDMETSKLHRGEQLGYCMALNQEQNFAGGSYLDVTNIIFEEFMSRSIYISQEPDKLQNLYSTIDRKRGTTKIWLVGNVITRACPYLVQWNLLKDVARMNQGDILVKEIPVDEKNTIRLAIEYTGHIKDSTSFVFGNNADMINKGEWQSEPQPHLPKSYNDYTVIFRCLFIYKTFSYIGEVLRDSETKEKVWFIYPKTKIYDNLYPLLTFSDIIKPSKYYNSDIYHCKIDNKRIQGFCDLFTEDNIFYSDDLTGTEFKNVINFSISK